MSVATLILKNANVITMEQGRPWARLVACADGMITYVGEDADLPRLRGPKTRVIDCQGMPLVPGFNDAHLHFMALAYSLVRVDCSPSAANSIKEIQAAIRQRAADTPAGHWVRGYGYDESALAEGRHPTRSDLDAAAPGHSVRLDHRTGHACVLNTRALEQVGIAAATPDTVDGVIQRDEAGQPTGILLEMNAFVSQRMKPQQYEWPQIAVATSELLLSKGITSFQDASPGNSVERFDAFRAMKRECRHGPRITVMPGFDHLDGFRERSMHYGFGDRDIRVGHAKLMLAATTGTLMPPLEELLNRVMEAQGRGFPVAIHAVEAEAVEAAAQVFTQVRVADEGIRLRHRIEHASECPPEALKQLQASGAVVVTQPGFIYHAGEKYRREVPQEMWPYLYPIATWVNMGAAVAFSSDAPVVPPNPIEGLYAAVTRRTVRGNALAEAEATDATTAMRLFTLGGAYAAGEENVKGSIRPGKLADLVLLDADPAVVGPETLKGIRVRLTIVGGEVAWEMES